MTMFDKIPIPSRIERAGEAALERLMANERFMEFLQAAIMKLMSAKGSIEQGVSGLMASLNLPSGGDVEALKEKVHALENAIAKLEARERERELTPHEHHESSHSKRKR